jgi:DNA-binding NarL/FixJ family response regulator
MVRQVSLATFLVEDSLTIRNNLIPAMEAMANVRAVGVVGSERDAADWLKEHADQWQLAVVDLFLSEGSGLGVLRECNGRRENQLVVVLTNYATDNIRQRCLAAGADVIFDKSTELEAFFSYCLEAPQHEVPASAPAHPTDDQLEARDLAQP